MIEQTLTLHHLAKKKKSVNDSCHLKYLMDHLSLLK